MKIHIIFYTFLTFSMSCPCLSAERSVLHNTEVLEYQAKIFNMPAATITFRLSRSDKSELLPMMDLLVKAKTNTLFTPLFHIDNEYASRIMLQNSLPLSLIKTIFQKNVSQVVTIIYNQDQHIAMLNDSSRWSLPDSCHNLFSMFYLLRSHDYYVGDTLAFYLDSEHIISKAKAIVAAEEVMQSAIGTLSTHRIEIAFTPFSELVRPWKTDLLTNRLATPYSEMTMWLSTDNERIPVRIEFKQRQYKVDLILKNMRTY